MRGAVVGWRCAASFGKGFDSLSRPALGFAQRTSAGLVEVADHSDSPNGWEPRTWGPLLHCAWAFRIYWNTALLLLQATNRMFVTHHREKLIQAIVYFATNTRHCGKIKLFKLLYLLDFEHFKQTGHSVTGMEYRAWKMGPVPIELMQEWDELEPDMQKAIDIRPEQVYSYERENVLPKIDFDPSHFTKRELRWLQSLANQYRDVFSAKMIDVTHAENGAWERVWNQGMGNDNRIDYELALEDGPDKEAILEIAKEYRAAVQQHGVRH